MSELNLKISEVFHLCSTKSKGSCPVRNCRRASRNGGTLCGTHHVAAWRKRNPMKAAWKNLKDHAKSRKKNFDLPFDFFAELCELTGYHNDKGRSPNSLSIDRIDARLGYVIGNIRVVTVSINSSKGSTEDRIRLKSGGEVLWECISVEAYDKEREERRQSFNPYPKKTEEEIEAALDEDLPPWLTKASKDDPF